MENKVLKIEHRGNSDVVSNPPAEYAEWLWDGYLRQNLIGLLAGHGESGKGIFSLQLAACVAAGEKFLGRTVKKGKVFYLSAEDDEEELRARLNKIAVKLNIHESRLADLETRSTLDLGIAPTLFDRKGKPTIFLNSLIEYRNTYNPILFVFDTFSAFGPTGDVTDSGTITAFMTTLAAILQTTILFTLHLRKPDGKSKDKRPDQHDIRDSSAIVSSGRSALILHKNCLTLPKCNGRNRCNNVVKADDELYMEIKNGAWMVDENRTTYVEKVKATTPKKGGKACDHLPEAV